MTTKIYAVYSIPKSPEYKLEKLFKTKEMAKNYIKQQKSGEYACDEYRSITGTRFLVRPREEIFDIQLEEVYE